MSGGSGVVGADDRHHVALLLQSGEVELAGHFGSELGGVTFSQVGRDAVLLEQLQGNAQIVVAGWLEVAFIVVAALVNALTHGPHDRCVQFFKFLCEVCHGYIGGELSLP